MIKVLCHYDEKSETHTFPTAPHVGHYLKIRNDYYKVVYIVLLVCDNRREVPKTEVWLSKKNPVLECLT